MPSITDLLPFLTTTRPQGTDGAGLSGPLDLTPVPPHARKATVPPAGASGQKANRVFSVADTTVLYSSTPPRYTDFHSYLQAYKLPWVNACVKVIAYNAANVGKKLVKPSPDGDESKDQDITASPFLDLLQKPNPNDTYFSLFELIISDLELTGNAYLALEGLDGAGRPAELYRVAPDRMTVLPATDRLVAGYRYWVSGKQSITYQPEEIIHMKYPNPCDHLYGMGIIEAGEARFDSERAMLEHERQFWNNGAKITGVLQTDSAVDGTTWERIRDSVRRFFQGKGYSTLILEAGLKYQSVSDGPAKLGMLEMAKASRDMILAQFGVPSTKLGILENANYKALASDEFFWSETIDPKLTRLEQALEQLCERFHPGAGYVLKFDRLNFSDDLPKAQVAAAMATTGALMVDELREYLSLDRLPDDAGQVVLVQGTLVPLDQATAPPPPPPPPPMLPPGMGATIRPAGLLEAGAPAVPAGGVPTPSAPGGQRNG